jgi:hypothetical protein
MPVCASSQGRNFRKFLIKMELSLVEVRSLILRILFPSVALCLPFSVRYTYRNAGIVKLIRPVNWPSIGPRTGILIFEKVAHKINA